MGLKEEAVVDCTLDTVRDARETYECTDSWPLRNQIGVLHLFVLFGWLFLAMCVIALVIGVSKRIRGQKFRDIPRAKLPVDVVAAQNSALSKNMAGALLAEFSRPSSVATFVTPTVSKERPWKEVREEVLASREFILSNARMSDELRPCAAGESLREYMMYVANTLEEAMTPAQRQAELESKEMGIREVCQYYVCLFEEVEYGSRQLTHQEYLFFVALLYALLPAVRGNTTTVARGHVSHYTGGSRDMRYNRPAASAARTGSSSYDAAAAFDGYGGSHGGKRSDGSRLLRARHGTAFGGGDGGRSRYD